jgi:hypothetical protein
MKIKIKIKIKIKNRYLKDKIVFCWRNENKKINIYEIVLKRTPFFKKKLEGHNNIFFLSPPLLSRAND